MTQKTDTASIERDAGRVAGEYEECATLYAEERAEVAEALGRKDAAEHWAAVEQKLLDADRDERCE